MSSEAVHLVKTENFEMEYIAFGQGARPLVIIPGISLKSVIPSAEAIIQGFTMFTQGWTVYVFDRKKNIQPGYSVAEMAEDTAAAMAQIGIAGADIFGASQGGMIAQCIALEHPELVHALYLGSTMSRNTPESTQLLLQWKALALGDDVAAMNRAFFEKVYSPAFYRQYREVFAAMEPDGAKEELARLAVLIDACLRFDVYDRLPEIQCPVFVVGSWQDSVLTGEASVELSRKLNCPLYLYTGYGHAVYDEAPDYRHRMLAALQTVE